MSITIDSTVGAVAAQYPLATRVFARHDIDFCCGGGRPLRDACEKRGLDTDAVIREIEKEIETAPFSPERWDTAPLNDVIDHILSAYHRPQLEEVRRLEAMARKVLAAHADKDGERLSEVLRVFVALQGELLEHFAKEEQILFPMIRAGQGAMADGPVSVMHQDHDGAAAALRRLRELTNDYQVPAEACTTWIALWRGLEAFEESLHQHIHLENNILFPRALQS